MAHDIHVRIDGHERTMSRAAVAALPLAQRAGVLVWVAPNGWVRPGRFADTGESLADDDGMLGVEPDADFELLGHNPDQPRDANGRFGEGSGAKDDGGSHPLGEAQRWGGAVTHDPAVSAADAKHILGGVHDVGMGEWLAAHPVGKIEVEYRANAGGTYLEAKPAKTIPASPAHTFRDRGKLIKKAARPELTIPAQGSLLASSPNRSADSFGKPFAPGAMKTLSSTATTARDAARMTLAHEVGHHLHLTSGKEVDAVVREAYEKAGASQRGHTISDYASGSHTEYFAETFAAHSYHGDALKAHDPVGHAMVERVRKMTGV